MLAECSRGHHDVLSEATATDLVYLLVVEVELATAV